MHAQRGFTLIELMAVVAIIAALVAIALPSYQRHVARSQFTAGLADIRGGVSAFESELVSEGIVTTDPLRVGLQTSTPRCSSISMDSSASGFIRCVLVGNSAVMGGQIALRRDATTAKWTCTTTVTDASVIPSICR